MPDHRDTEKQADKVNEKTHEVHGIVNEGETEQELKEAYHAQSFFRKPLFQVFLVSFTCFLCPGMFNALNGLGGGGFQDAQTADNGNVALYSTFSVFGFFGGSICNKLGVKLTLFCGTLGYGVYMASLYSTTISQSKARENFVIAAGAILGVCAGLLWTAQGAIMLSYSTEKTKGRYIAFFWGIFNLGAVIGACIPLGRNWNNVGGSVEPNTYIAFIVLCFVGSFLPWFLSSPSKVIKEDGTRPDVVRHPSWLAEFKALYIALRNDPWILFLFPYFMASNWFYTWQFAGFNGSGLFSLRARTLNNFLYWTAQIFGSAIAGFYLDNPFLGRRLRAMTGWAGLFAIVMAVFGGNYAVQKTYTRESVVADGFVPVDIHDSRYPGYVWLYIFNGVLDAVYQTYVYWSLGSLSNSLSKLALLTGWYKGLQSAGSAITFRIDALKKPYMTELASTWGVISGAMVIALPLLFIRIQDHTEETVDAETGAVKVEKVSA